MNTKTTAKVSFRHTLQWKLTLIITFSVTLTCILMYFFISHSAVTGMESLKNYVIQVSPQNSEELITLNVDPQALIPDLSEKIQATKNQFLMKSVVVTAAIILLNSICTYFLTRKTLSPLKQLNEKITRIQAQNLSARLPVPNSQDEIARLTLSFNEMLARLDNAFSIQKQFSANAAHELRTPLAVLQTNLEVFQKKGSPDIGEYQQLFSMIQEHLGRLTHLVGTLLDMTNLQSVPRSDKISLAALSEEVFCDLDLVAEQSHITLVQENGDCMVTGSYVLLYRAVYNLVENAIKYNKPQGTVTLSIQQKGQDVLLSVKDTGIGISLENQEKIFDPFFRVDKSRSRAMGGAGLGLALVDAIAREHHGQVKVLSSSSDGTIIGLSLPVASM